MGEVPRAERNRKIVVYIAAMYDMLYVLEGFTDDGSICNP